MRVIGRVISVIAAAGLITATAAVVTAMSFGPWSAAARAESIPGTSGNLNTANLEGCPFVSQRGDILYFASNRAGGMGGLDIWYSVSNERGGWGDPVNFTEVNSPANELCPMTHRNGKMFMFVSNRAGGCGRDDLYVTRQHATRGWAAALNLGCTVNSAADEASPTVLETELYFSSTRAGGGDIYVSPFDGVAFGTPTLAPGLNSIQDDFRPNLRRDGLEVFFDSNRPGGIGGLDIWTSTRASTAEAWSMPVNLGHNVNSGANDLRASLSWDSTTLYFGSVRAGGEGSQDLYTTTR